MKVHILNGDCLQEILQANDVLMIREMFVEGPLHFESWEVFFRERASYLEKTYAISLDEYQRKSVFEIEKIKQISNHSEVYLWFDYDLFCFVNLLFILQILIKNKTLKLFLIRPLRKRQFSIWKGFGQHTKSDLMLAFSKKTLLKTRDCNDLLHIWNRLGKKVTIKNHRLIPFLAKHLRDYQRIPQAKEIEASWGFTKEQINSKSNFQKVGL